MKKKRLNITFIKQHLILFLIFFIIIGIYSNTFNASWHLDDDPNIIYNIYLHIDNLSPKSLINTFYTNPSNPFELGDKMYRPVACLSLALNWYLGKNSVFGYHLVNIAIHVITVFLLYLLLLNLLNCLQIKKNSSTSLTSPQIFIIAFFTALFWAVHPIQTQAVTYIVQRMASMSAMFYIMGMFCYLKGKRKNLALTSHYGEDITKKSNIIHDSKSLIWYACCFVCFILSFNSKENGILLPISILLVEIIFFQNLSDKKVIKRLFIAGFIVGISLILLGGFLFVYEKINILKSYETRTFSLTERILVQPRVLVFHLSQIFFPLPDRFSIAHDFVLSSSPFKPWTTIPSIFFIFSLIGFAIYKIKELPLLSFAILFFFINHVIESTILPLEIVFEHRNYLPSMFLFLPIIFWCSQLINRYSQEKQVFKYWLVIGLLIATAISFSASTYIRNKVWKDDITLWSDAFKKAPNDARAANILAIKLAWGDNSRHPKRYDMALQLFEKSLTMYMPSISVKADIVGNMANVYSNNKQDYNKALSLYKEALIMNPRSRKIRRDMVVTLVRMANYDDALSNINILFSQDDKNWEYHNLKGFILLWQGNKYNEAFASFQKAFRMLKEENGIPPNSLLLNIGVTMSLKGNHTIADELMSDMIKEDMLKTNVDLGNLSFYLALIQNSLLAGDKTKAEEYTSRMVILFGKETVVKNIPSLLDNRATAPISKKMVEPLIIDFINSL